MLRSICIQSGESVELVLEKKREVAVEGFAEKESHGAGLPRFSWERDR